VLPEGLGKLQILSDTQTDGQIKTDTQIYGQTPWDTETDTNECTDGKTKSPI
jgi:hypothetical protein